MCEKTEKVSKSKNGVRRCGEVLEKARGGAGAAPEGGPRPTESFPRRGTCAAHTHAWTQPRARGWRFGAPHGAWAKIAENVEHRH